MLRVILRYGHELHETGSGPAGKVGQLQILDVPKSEKLRMHTGYHRTYKNSSISSKGFQGDWFSCIFFTKKASGV